MNRRTFLCGSLGLAASTRLGYPLAIAGGIGAPAFRTRGVVLVPEDLTLADWPERAKAAGLTTIGIHHQNSPRAVIDWIRTDAGRRFLETCRKLGLEIEYELHAMKELLPRRLYEKSPEFFRLDERGHRSPDANLCVHSPAALGIAAGNAVAIAKALRPTTGRYFYWGDDGKPWCRCPECKGLSDSDQATLLENHLLRALRRHDPRASLAHLAYTNTLSPPKLVKPEPGIFLEYAPIKRRYDIPYEKQAGPGQADGLAALDANLKVFPADTAQVLEYWLDVSRFSHWKRPAVRLPWRRDVLEADLGTYASRGIRHVTSFAVYVDADYRRRYGEPGFIREYGEVLLGCDGAEGGWLAEGMRRVVPTLSRGEKSEAGGGPEMPRDHSDENVLALVVARHLDLDPERLTLRRSPAGKFNETYFVEGGPVPLVLRVAPPDDRSRMLFYEHHMMRQEPGLHALVRGRTDVPVPAVLAHDFSHTAIDRDYLLMERLPGTPISHLGGLTQGAFDDLLRQVGRYLRQAHEITGDRYGYVGDHRPMEPQADWPSAFHVMWHKLLDDIGRCEGYTPDEATRMRRLLDQHAHVFDRPVPASLLHMDVWAENILADESGRLTGLIDWDRACWGDPEIEFAVLDYCGISEPPFWKGYGAVRDRSPEAEVRRLFYLLYEVQKYIVIRRVRGNDPVRADGYRRQCLRLAEQLAGIGGLP